MNKRQKKKLHKKFLNDVVYAISVSSVWRKRLFVSGYQEKIIIARNDINELPQHIKYPVFRYNLRYCVYKTDRILDDSIYYDGGVFFLFQSIKFEEIFAYSCNNTDVI